MKHKIFIITTILLISSFKFHSQNRTVQGTVKNNFDEPIESVFVKIKGNDMGVFTDSTGFYSILVPPKSKLIFSQISHGYKTQKISVKGKDILDVFLEYNLKAKPYEGKDVNTGYGKIKQSESTISVSSVDEKLIERENNLDMATFLRTVPGVTVTDDGGNLGIVIRGNRSLMSSDAPLIMLNGSPYNGSLKNLNPRDIKSIDVLKDASATVAYGSRGANGVILITTK
ncbi:TonB-dependent receptor plug domain-containing protein [Confluentibacter flavum]|uniref:TonB-dependent receptor plug domain-containing protein n=1 Tax=Confluentibacter flavum TaxID=1909700 RepID=A0A2N3HMN6_9FLAO|nr:TonB-dependent receptor plug domain-containing protein [Confluentibacter flavum]PKQ46223.1 hypothetical protein CSW08_03410 [Confluentibacter flavum]